MVVGGLDDVDTFCNFGELTVFMFTIKCYRTPNEYFKSNQELMNLFSRFTSQKG